MRPKIERHQLFTIFPSLSSELKRSNHIRTSLYCTYLGPIINENEEGQDY